jgi:aspartate/glutamate racemase
MTRILGIVGGTGPESTVDYYRSIVASWQRRNADGSYPCVIINSVEAGRIFRLLGEGDFSAVAGDMTTAIDQLAAAGAGAALLAANAPGFCRNRGRLPDPADSHRRRRSRRSPGAGLPGGIRQRAAAQR